jgi:hypothetical protein
MWGKIRKPLLLAPYAGDAGESAPNKPTVSPKRLRLGWRRTPDAASTEQSFPSIGFATCDWLKTEMKICRTDPSAAWIPPRGTTLAVAAPRRLELPRCFQVGR